VDLEAKRVTQTFDVGNGPDVLALDEGKGRLYVAAESGQVAVFDVSGPSVHKLWQDEIGPDAHSVAVDPDTHIVYLPLTDVDGHPVLRELQPT
jgi:DNA-binding beta-propeller fold protein YncE